MGKEEEETDLQETLTSKLRTEGRKEGKKEGWRRIRGGGKQENEEGVNWIKKDEEEIIMINV